MSTGQIDTLLDLWVAMLIQYDNSPPFASHRDLYDTIDSTLLGDVAWESFSMSYKGVKPAEDVLPWMKATYEVCDWAWTQADKIAKDPEMHRSTFMPLIVGSDKTTVLVATGHTKYHPLYLSIGNVFNSVQCAHCNSLVLVGFLTIPTTTKEYADDIDF
ncbi:uncharacterized protein BJ212DRAFT_1304951 [Suillus subaureus]|uniref:Uncharacterized protein n=1 Tax=Suillus subaureus TaxID=48587 RepID=A0A9P7J488_9AGAM|nr:uncharacterized protein BJ212DRAFT_1304951 [Suillus subaureus]KAG1801896.1 hypothetical protein BJ212DRAFT_1304951 [Suillus subaureus]